MKTAKRLIMGNTNTDGSLNTEAMMHGLLQYRNTPLQKVGLSPAQMLLHRNLKDALPAFPSSYKMDKFWIEQAEIRLKWKEERKKKSQDVGVSKLRALKALVPGSRVRIQTKRKGQKSRWKETGTVVSSEGNRQYAVRVDSTGNTTLRNRRHIREMLQERGGRERYLPTARVRGDTKLVAPVARTVDRNPVSQSPGTADRMLHPPESQHGTQSNGTGITVPQVNERVPRALARLLPFNKPGLTETM